MYIPANVARVPNPVCNAVGDGVTCVVVADGYPEIKGWIPAPYCCAVCNGWYILWNSNCFCASNSACLWACCCWPNALSPEIWEPNNPWVWPANPNCWLYCWAANC